MMTPNPRSNGPSLPPLHPNLSHRSRRRGRAMKTTYCVAGLVVVFLCSGCVVFRQTYSPGAEGVVIDSQSHSPIAGVEVAVSEARDAALSITNALAELREPTVHTNPDGRFTVPAQRSLNFGLILFWWPSHTTNSAPLPSGTLVLRRDGYVPATIPFCSELVTNLGEVWMKPIPQ